MARRLPLRVGIDTGGTFTDVVCGRTARKVPSTPTRPEKAFLAALEVTGEDPQALAVCHGTTVGTNAVLTRSGARVAFVTTAGFEDLPWLGRGHRDQLHALHPHRLEPLLDRKLSFGLAERVDASGTVLSRPSDAALRQLRAQVEAGAPDAVAVCLLHAVQNGAHERAVRRALRGLRIPIHLSSEVCADPREAERGQTTTLDAYVSPMLRRYLGSVRRALPAAARPHFTVMRSDGGRMTVREVAKAPVRTLLSGPAAGVVAAAAFAGRVGEARALSFDVGGTSTDVAWIDGEDLAVRPSLRVGPFEALVPSIGMETVGAGGGSVVALDTGGALVVGPRSAGAQPGPACYGAGGPFTLTDAWLLLRHVPDALLGGAFPLDRSAAEAAGRRLARQARLTLPRLCEGAVSVAAATTARALSLASVAAGNDPRTAALIAFGGAGPVLAARTAEHLGIERVYVPPAPGTMAALGARSAPLRADRTQVVTAVAPSKLAGLALRLGQAVRKTLQSDGARRVRLRPEVDARYAGQATEVTVPFEADWRHDFHRGHAARYGFADPTRTVEAVRLRVRGEGHEGPARRKGAMANPPRYRTKATPRSGACHRSELRVGARMQGPVRIDEETGTTWVPAGWRAEVPGVGVLRLRRTS